MKKTIIMLGLALASWAAFAQHDHGAHGHDDKKKEMSHMGPMFRDQKVGNVYAQYIDLKDALVATDVIKAQDAAVQLVLSLPGVKNGAKVMAEAKKVTGAKNIEDQRKMFVRLSDEMINLVKASKLSMGAVYVDYCPMANDNSGAYWLANEATITNPYFGDKMLTCGSLKETIK